MDNLLTNLTQKEAEDAWKYLEDAMDLIAIRQIQNLSFQELYHRAYKLVINKYGNYAYEKLTQKLVKVFSGLIRRIIDSHRDLFLQNLVGVWQDVNFITALMCDIFLYMDKNFLPREKKKSIRLLCLEIYRRMLFDDNHELSQKILTNLLEEIKLDRDGVIIERSILKNSIQILLEIDQICQVTFNHSYNCSQQQYIYSNSDKFYKQYFEGKLIRETQKYYNEESNRIIKSLSVEDYLRHCKKRLDGEIDRVKCYLYQSSEKPIRDAFIQFMITNQAIYCLKAENKDLRFTGLIYFLDMGDIQNLTDSYSLFIQSQQSFEIFLDSLQKYILNNGSQILQDRKQLKPDENDQVLEQFIQFTERFDEYQKIQFKQGTINQQQQLSRMILDTLEQLVNKDIFLTVQLNKSLDLCFKKDFRTRLTDEAEKKLLRNFNLFKLIKQKDIFENHYRKLLSRRLIDGTSISDEFEKIFVTQIKRECGSSFTSKIETMFKDMEISKVELADFKKNVRNIAHQGQKPLLAAIDLEFYVLTMGHWPLQDPLQFNLCDELKFWKNNFEKYYLQKNKQRKLTWYYNLGFVDVKAHYPHDKKKEFITSTLQACILIMFNQDEALLIQDILSKLEINIETLKKEIVTLIYMQILLKKQINQQNTSKNINEIYESLNENDIIVRNPEFTHKSYKLKISQQQQYQFDLKNKQLNQSNSINSINLDNNHNNNNYYNNNSHVKEEQDVRDEVIVERKFVIESLIVRVMKARKQLDHTRLVDQVIELAQQRHFIPDQLIIKKAIESLISRDYLERNDENKNYYIYKA